MTGREIVLFVAGMDAGVVLMLAAHFIGAAAAERRDRQQLQAALAKTAREDA